MQLLKHKNSTRNFLLIERWNQTLEGTAQIFFFFWIDFNIFHQQQERDKAWISPIQTEATEAGRLSEQK